MALTFLVGTGENLYAYSILNSYSSIGRYEAERLRTEFAALGVDFDVKENRPGTEFPVADFVVFLDKDVRLAVELESYGYTLFNSAEAIRICDDKALTYTALAGVGVNYPHTIFAPLCYADLSNYPFKVAEDAETVAQKLGFPLVFKLNTGSLGTGVFKVENMSRLRELMVEYARVPHHYQRYVATANGADTRIIVIGGRAVAAMRRHNAEDFRSNVAVGGVAVKCTPPKDYVALAEKAASALKLDFCGVDILEGEGGAPLLAEVNSNAFYKGIESVSGVNVARLYAEYMLNKISR